MEGEKGGDVGATEKVGSGEGKVQGQFKTDGTEGVGLKSSTQQARLGVSWKQQNLTSAQSQEVKTSLTKLFFIIFVF